MKSLRLFASVAAFSLLAHVGFGQVFTYTFSDVTTGSGLTSAGGVASNLTFSSFSATGVSANSSAANLFGFSGWDTGATTGSDTFSGVVNTGKYYQFSVTPQEGFQFSLTNFTFDAGRSATGTRQFVIRSSADNYTANLAASGTGVVSVVGSNIFQFTDNSSTNLVAGQSITLSGGSFTNATSALTFRIFAYNAEGTSGTFRIDNFAINGSASAIPEPSTYAAIFGVLALVGVIAHRRRKQRAA